MEWKVLAALAFLGLALLGGLVICIVTSVNSYAKRIAEEPKDKRRGFEVKQTITTGEAPAVQREKDDHHG
jgi:hypothetical protein